MCKLTKKLLLQTIGSARLKVIFLCNVLIIALVYNQSVYAAYNSTLRIYVSGRLADTLDNAVNFCVYPSDASHIASLDKSITGNAYYPSNSNVYDLCIPIYFQADQAYSSGGYAVTMYFAPGIHIIPDQMVTFVSAYADTTDFFSFTYVGSGGSPQLIQPGTDLSLTSRINFFDFPFRGNYSSVFYLHYYFVRYVSSTVSSDPGPRAVNFKVYSPYTSFINDTHISADNTVVGGLQDIDDTLKDQRQEDKDDAGQAGDDATDLVSNLDTQIKSKWEILWYPIDFTKSLLGVFTGSTARSYNQSGVVGYTYNSRDGTLEPVVDFSRAAVRAVQGTTITFPSFSIMGLQVWDAYDYDLSQVKSDFPALFDAIYVVVSVLEVYWFVGFLRNKYDEVFG